MKDYKKILEDFNNMTIDDLPDVNITNEQKEKARKKLFKAIDSLKKVNGDLKIDITKEEILDLKNALGSKSEEYLNGVKHGRVLREVALKATRDEVLSKYGEIICETFCNNDYGCRVGGALHIKVYIVKEKLITYSFSEFYKVIDKKVVNLKDIRGAGLYEDKMYYIECDKCIMYLGYTLENTKSELENIMSIITKDGIENNSYYKKRKEKTVIIVNVIIVIIYMAIFFIIGKTSSF